jgi:hypothetical protein
VLAGGIVSGVGVGGSAVSIESIERDHEACEAVSDERIELRSAARDTR